ncbi:hypothetical protein GCM10027294_00670 [Marinactinospora endophytica]
MSRIAADGSEFTVEGAAPLGSLSWSGITRISGDAFHRQYSIAPAGRHEVIPRKLLPGAREEVRHHRGHDLLLYNGEAQSCLVWAGPHHDAVSWFAGPAPSGDALERVIGVVEFVDAPGGASVRPVAGDSFRQFGTVAIGRCDEAVLMVRSARDALPDLPEWQGLTRDDVEIWRMPVDDGAGDSAPREDSPFGWRYMIAGESALLEVIFVGPSGDVPKMAESDVGSVLENIQARWT